MLLRGYGASFHQHQRRRRERRRSRDELPEWRDCERDSDPADVREHTAAQEETSGASPPPLWVCDLSYCYPRRRLPLLECPLRRMKTSSEVSCGALQHDYRFEW